MALKQKYKVVKGDDGKFKLIKREMPINPGAALSIEKNALDKRVAQETKGVK